MPNLSQRGFQFLKTIEGYKHIAYTLPGESYPTVGIGHHAKDLVNGRYYSDAQIMAFFKQDHAYVRGHVMKYWHEPMTQQMFDAMFLLTYNMGHFPQMLGNQIKKDFTNRSAIATIWYNSGVGNRYGPALRKRRKQEINIYFGANVTGGEMDLSEYGDYGNDMGGGGMFNQNTFTFTGPVITSSTASVLAKSKSNIYSRITASEKKNNIKHTRIYKYTEPTIKLDELSLPLSGQNTRINPSTGEHLKEKDTDKEDYSKDKKTSVNTKKKTKASTKKSTGKRYGIGEDRDPGDADNDTTNIEETLEVDSTDTDTSEDTPSDAIDNAGSGGYDIEMTESNNPRGYRHTDFRKAAGQSFPIIRINDYYVAASEIMAFEIETIGFIPIARLSIKSTNNHLLKNDTIKEGDKMSVFCAPGHGMIKSLRCDFLIT